MLRRTWLALAVTLCLSTLVPRVALADDTCTAQAFGGSALPITAEVTCSGSSTGSSGTSSSSGNASDGGCYRVDGTPMACWYGDYWWSPAFNTYCQVDNVPPDSSIWDQHRDANGNPVGTYYQCLLTVGGELRNVQRWANDTPTTPDLPGVDPEALVRTALAELGLHPPTAGVGAYIYPGYEDWGLSWWVGAPMWLWIDTSDPLQWGSHTLTASESGTSGTATVTPTSVTYSTGDGGMETCTTGGTYRPWNPNDLLSHHSPSGCEHTYMTINTKGDRTSRFTVSATVLWTITWTATTGQAGSFTTTLESTSSASIHVGELHVVTIPNP